MKKNIVTRTIVLVVILCIVGSFLVSTNTSASIDVKSETKVAVNETNSTANLPEYNNNLKSLKIQGFEFFPEFNKNTTTYYVSIPTDIEELDISAEAESEDATVRITGNTYLSSYEENTIKISVSPELGDRKTYYIIATMQEDNGLKLTNLEVENATLDPIFEQKRYYYSVDITQNDEVKPLNITATPNTETAKVEIVGNDASLSEGEGIISIILTDDDNTTIYQLKTNLKIEKGIVQTVKNEEEKNGINFDEIKEKIKSFFEDETKVIALLVAIAAVLLVVIIIIVIKMLKRSKSDKNKEKIKKRAK